MIVAPCVTNRRVKRPDSIVSGGQLVEKSTAVQNVVVSTMMREVSTENLAVSDRKIMSALKSPDQIV